MDMKQQLLIAATLAMGFILWNNWQNFNAESQLPAETLQVNGNTGNSNALVPTAPIDSELNKATGSGVPAPVSSITQLESTSNNAQFITVETDLVTAIINTQGGGIESLTLKQEAENAETPEIGFALLKNTPREIFVSQSGLIGSSGTYPNHTSLYNSVKNDYVLQDGEGSLQVPLTWKSPEGLEYTKTFIFNRDSYIVDVNFNVENTSSTPWQGYMYGQFKRTQPLDAKKGSFVQLPSFLGGVQYTPENKYDKVSFDDISDENLTLDTDSGWIGMLQHYFVGVWMPQNNADKTAKYNFYSSYKEKPVISEYTMGFKSLNPTIVQPGQSGFIQTSAFIGPKTQKRLKAIEKEKKIEGLALTVDYGWLTVISDPLFWILDKIHSLVNNWGWSIIILTILIKLVFFPLSAASYKSMARMKKLQPRMETLKERFGDDRAALQQEMMKLYKQEKVNPAGGCLPILIQIPVFIALYYVLLESVEIRHAPFALWIQDLSSQDPYYILPILMGVSMMLQFRLNPTPMEPMQQKIMMIMPIAMTFLFVTFPAGLVLYWVVNNILSIAQQWTINRTIGANNS